MAKKSGCKRVTFKKGSSGHRLAKPVTVTLCDRGPGKPAKRKAGRAGARAVCHAGGTLTEARAKVRANFKRGMKGPKALAPMRFTRCR